MTPSEREEVAKGIMPAPISINSEVEVPSVDESDDTAREVRNKYLKRIGVGEGGNSSDCEPLLQ